MIVTHRYSPPKNSLAGGIMLLYSPPSMLSHCRRPQIICTIAFTAGLNTLQVDYVKITRNCIYSCFLSYLCLQSKVGGWEESDSAPSNRKCIQNYTLTFTLGVDSIMFSCGLVSYSCWTPWVNGIHLYKRSQ